MELFVEKMVKMCHSLSVTTYGGVHLVGKSATFAKLVCVRRQSTSDTDEFPLVAQLG